MKFFRRLPDVVTNCLIAVCYAAIVVSIVGIIYTLVSVKYIYIINPGANGVISTTMRGVWWGSDSPIVVKDVREYVGNEASCIGLKDSPQGAATSIKFYHPDGQQDEFFLDSYDGDMVLICDRQIDTAKLLDAADDQGRSG